VIDGNRKLNVAASKLPPGPVPQTHVGVRGRSDPAFAALVKDERGEEREFPFVGAYLASKLASHSSSEPAFKSSKR
jgi:hypothetical protein